MLNSPHVRFEIQIDTDNDAVVGDPHGEIASVLSQIAEQIADGVLPQPGCMIRDTNGNTIGHLIFEVR